MAVALSPDQELATKTFLNTLSESGASNVSRGTALKFLFARKFEVSRAFALWRQHESTRRREGLNKFEPFEDPLKSELETGKFTILSSRDATGAAIAVFTANKHFPASTSHQTTLQGVVYQLDVALQSLDTQRAGLVFIYDMTDSKYGNFDYELSQKILTMLKYWADKKYALKKSVAQKNASASRTGGGVDVLPPITEMDERFISVMGGSSFAVGDQELTVPLIISPGAYPAKLKKVLIVTAPLWFKAPFRILRLFVREKLRERVHTVSAPQLGFYVPRASLPKQLGGHLEIDHVAWLEHCKNCYTNNIQTSKLDTVNDEYVISNHIPPVKPQNGVIEGAHEMSSGECEQGANMHISGDRHTPPYTCRSNPIRHTHGYNGDMKSRNTNSGDEDDLDISSRTGAWSSGSGSAGASDEECGRGGAGLAPRALLLHARSSGRRGLHHEYAELRAARPVGTFHNAKLPSNLPKNRYTDVLCYDHSRVILSQTDPDDPTTDYINANYVDGYKQKNAFICTQGPLPKTFSDFWRMVWEQGTLVIVMTTRTVERGRVKCGQYWPLSPGSRVEHGGFAITTESVEEDEDYTISNLVLTNLRTEETRSVWHGQYTRWPDYGVPGGGSARPVLQFLMRVRDEQRNATQRMGDTWAGHSRGPPIVVHCSAGIGRTGTFLTLDICTSRLSAEGVCDVRGVVERVREQRAHSIQMPEQYVFCHLALLQYAVMNGFLESAELTGFDDDAELESE